MVSLAYCWCGSGNTVDSGWRRDPQPEEVAHREWKLLNKSVNKDRPGSSREEQVDLEKVARLTKVELNRLNEENKELKIDNERLKQLGIPDGGQYREDWITRLKRVLAENERQAKALRFYANPRNYRWLGAYESEVVGDGGKHARAALSPSGENTQ